MIKFFKENIIFFASSAALAGLFVYASAPANTSSFSQTNREQTNLVSNANTVDTLDNANTASVQSTPDTVSPASTPSTKTKTSANKIITHRPSRHNLGDDDERFEDD